MYNLKKSAHTSEDFDLPPFVIGHAIRTTHAIELTEDAKVPGLWQRVMADERLLDLPGKFGDHYYAVLNDYEPDQHGWYTKVAGIGVKHLIDIPADLVAVAIPHKKRLVYEALADMPAALLEAWDRVWEQTPSTSRRIATDVEVHSSEGAIHILAMESPEGNIK